MNGIQFHIVIIACENHRLVPLIGRIPNGTLLNPLTASVNVRP